MNIELPNGWASTKVKSAVAKAPIANENKIKQRDYLPYGRFPVIDQGLDYIGGYFDDDKKVVNCDLPVIVFGDHTKITKYVNHSFCAGADGIKIIIPPAFFNPKCLYYFICFLSKKLPDKGYARHYQYLEKELLPIPPSIEQQRIVEKIDKLFSELDKGVETLHTIKKQLRIYRQAVLKRLFSWEIPNSLGIKLKEIVPIMTLCSSISDGDHQAPPQVNIGVPFLVISNITSGRVNYESTRFVPESYFSALDSKRKPKTGDVLYSVTGSFGIPAIVESDKEFCIQRHIALLRPKDVKSEYLFYLLQTPQVYLKAKSIATGTAQLTVPIKGLRLIEIPIPNSKEEQRRIIAEVESHLSLCDKLESIVDECLVKTEALRHSILKKAFAGELVPQDPKDESAEKLLERIKAEMNQKNTNPKSARRKNNV